MLQYVAVGSGIAKRNIPELHLFHHIRTGVLFLQCAVILRQTHEFRQIIHVRLVFRHLFGKSGKLPGHQLDQFKRGRNQSYEHPRRELSLRKGIKQNKDDYQGYRHGNQAGAFHFNIIPEHYAHCNFSCRFILFQPFFIQPVRVTEECPFFRTLPFRQDLMQVLSLSCLFFRIPVCLIIFFSRLQGNPEQRYGDSQYGQPYPPYLQCKDNKQR